MKELDPADGHIFEITHRALGSYSVGGNPKHYFEPEENLITAPAFTFRVQAWSLVEALEKAANLPFNVLMGEEEE